MRIRPAEIQDLPALKKLYAELDNFHRQALPEIFSSSPRPNEYFQKILTEPQSLILVAEEEKSLLGFVHLYQGFGPAFLLKPKRFVVVEDLLVSKRFRRQGIGRQLMAQAQRWAQAQGADLLELNVWEFNDLGRSFYESFGFKTVSRRLWLKLN